MNGDYLMGAPMPYRGAGFGYAPSFLSTQMPQNNNSTNIIWTMGLESAKAYPLFPGRTILLMDSESPRFFIKTVDNNGYATLKAYTFQEEAPATVSAKAPETAAFVTHEQLFAAVDDIKQQLDKVIAAQKPVEKEKVEIEVEKTKTKNLL